MQATEERQRWRPIHPSERRAVRTVRCLTECGTPVEVTGIPDRIVTTGPLPKGLRIRPVDGDLVALGVEIVPSHATVIEVTR